MRGVCTTGGGSFDKGLCDISRGKVPQKRGVLGPEKCNKFYADEAGMQGMCGWVENNGFDRKKGIGYKILFVAKM